MAQSKRTAAPRGKVKKPKQPDNVEQSGSTGRRAPRDAADGKDTGQGRYGQSAVAGPQTETEGQARYRGSAGAGDPASKRRSNSGSGQSDRDETRERKRPPGARR